MDKQNAVLQERRVVEILESDADAASKAQQIVHLGFEPEFADDLVGQYQIGQASRFEYFEKIGKLDEDEVYADEADDRLAA